MCMPLHPTMQYTACDCTNLTGDYATMADDCATPTSILHKLMQTVYVQYVCVPVSNCANRQTADCATLTGCYATHAQPLMYVALEGSV